MPKEMLVYACGPIGGLSYDEASDWREELRVILAARCPAAIVLSPLRGREELRKIEKLQVRTGGYLTGKPICTPRGAALRDELDVRRSDIIFANFLGAKQISIGSVAEIGMARALGKVTIILMEADNIHRHFLLEEWSGYVVASWEEGVELLVQLINV